MMNRIHNTINSMTRPAGRWFISGLNLSFSHVGGAGPCLLHTARPAVCTCTHNTHTCSLQFSVSDYSQPRSESGVFSIRKYFGFYVNYYVTEASLQYASIAFANCFSSPGSLNRKLEQKRKRCLNLNWMLGKNVSMWNYFVVLADFIVWRTTSHISLSCLVTTRCLGLSF